MDNKEEIASGIVGSMGLFGGRNPMAGGQAIPIPANDMEIRGPIALMVNKLAAIDSTLKARLNQVKAMSSRNVLQAREDAVEAPSPAGANDNDLQADAEQETKKSDAARIAAVAGIAGLVALQFEPVQEAVKGIFSFAKDTISFLSSGFSIISDGLEFFLGGSTTGAVTPAAPSTPTTPTAPEIDTPDATPNVAEQSSPNFMSSVSGGALFGGALGFIVGKTGVGAAVGAAVGAYSYFSGGTGSTQQQSSSRTSSGVTGGAITRVTPSSSSSSNNLQARENAGLSPSPASNGMSYIYTTSGLSAMVASSQAEKFQGFINDLEATGYKINSLGGYANRNVAGTNKKSYHASGMAIDINPQQNPHTFPGDPNYGQTNMPENVGEIARKHGLGWGGNWRSSKDTMHFSAAASEQGSAPNPIGDVGAAAGAGAGGGAGGGLMGSLGDIATGVGRAAARIVKAASGDYTSRGLTESLNQGGDMASAITAAEIAKNNALADSNKKPSSSPTILPNINAQNGPAPVQNVPQWSDITSTDHYLIRFGIDSPRPMRVLRPMAA